MSYGIILIKNILKIKKILLKPSHTDVLLGDYKTSVEKNWA